MSEFVVNVMWAWGQQSWLWLLCGPAQGSTLAFGYYLIAYLIGGPDDA